jgi:Flp pilus assembly pilin Flp
MSNSGIRRFLEDRSGVAAVEFGLSISILVVILMGCFETGRYLLLRQKLDRASTAVSDLVTRSSSPLTNADLTQIFQGADDTVMPFYVPARIRMVVSSLKGTDDPTKPTVLWQCWGGGSLGGQVSRVGTEGGEGKVPSYFPVTKDENVVIAEVLYHYEPILFDGIFSEDTVRHITYTRPRNVSLEGKPAGCPSS